MKKFNKKTREFLRSFWGRLAFAVIVFATLLIIDLKGASLSTLGWRNFLGSIVGTAIISAGMFTISDNRLKS
jgi:hypothetical protein